MHEHGKSDSPIVPEKLPNKAAAAEVVEERGLAKGNAASSTRPGHSAGRDVSSGLDRVREVARRDKGVRFTALLHHVTIDRLRSAYRAIVAIQPGLMAAGSQGPVVNSWCRASSWSMPHFAAVDR